ADPSSFGAYRTTETNAKFSSGWDAQWGNWSRRILLMLTLIDFRTIKSVVVLAITIRALIRQSCSLCDYLSVARDFSIASPPVITIRVGELKSEFIAETKLLGRPGIAFLPFIGAPKVRTGAVVPVGLPLKKALVIPLLVP